MTNLIKAAQGILNAYEHSLEQDLYGALESRIEALRQALAECDVVSIKPNFHPLWLFQNGDGSYTSNGFSVSFKDGEIISVSKGFATVSQGFGLAEYQALKQERDRYRKALVDIADLSRWDMQTSYEEIEKVSANNGAWIDAECAHGIINEALKD